LHKDGFASLALDQVRGLDTSWIDITDYNLRAVLRKAKRGGTTNPGTAACNERNLPAKLNEGVFMRVSRALETSDHDAGCASGNFHVPFKISGRGR
jgi:hypothetical protein